MLALTITLDRKSKVYVQKQMFPKDKTLPKYKGVISMQFEG